jgi:membrane-anchored mycosin MYCP
MEQVHQIAQGEGQSLALIDTGVYTHKFFQDRLKPGGDYVKSTGGLKDCDGHGTEVAGIMAADTHFHGANENVGFDGMAPKATVYSARTTSSNYTYKVGDKKIHAGNLQTLGLAIDHLVDTVPDLDAINISLTACVPVGQRVSANYRFLQAAIHHAVAEKDVVVVVAAGNTAPNASKGCTANNAIPSPKYLKAVPIPAWFGHDVLTVGAMNSAGNPAGFSVHGPWVDVAAPGTDIVSLNPAADNLVNRSVENVGRLSATGQESGGSGGASRKPMKIQGTSFAAPYVTGLVGLVRQKFPWLDAHQVMHRIEMTAVHPATTSGRNNVVGYGMIDPMAALTDIVPGEPDPEGAAAPVAHAQSIPPALPAPENRNWTAVIVALAGTGGGVTLLLVTLFVVHTLRRNRRRRA